MRPPRMSSHSQGQRLASLLKYSRWSFLHSNHVLFHCHFLHLVPLSPWQGGHQCLYEFDRQDIIWKIGDGLTNRSGYRRGAVGGGAEIFWHLHGAGVNNRKYWVKACNDKHPNHAITLWRQQLERCRGKLWGSIQCVSDESYALRTGRDKLEHARVWGVT